MIDPVQQLLDDSFTHHKTGKLSEAFNGYMGLLNRNPYDATLLYLVGNVFLQQQHNGLAITMLEAALRSDGKLEGAWNDLGCALKAEHYDEAAMHAWERTIELGGRSAGTLNNLATLYADSGYPEKALPYIEEALKLEPENPHVHWNRALALLSQGDWHDGWQEHEYRYKVSNKNVGLREYAPIWDRQKDGLLVVHGEQGLGDEIMFASCIPDLLAEHPNTIIECEKKLVNLFQRSFGVQCFASEEEIKAAGIKADYQIGMGSLPRLYRNKDSDFPRHSVQYLIPDPALVSEATEMLKSVAGPLIGVSWMGGTKITRVQHRSLSAAAMKEIVGKGATAVSLQYGEYADVEGDAAGLIRLGEWTNGKDLNKLAAVVFLMDEVVSVCTTLIHLTGALGRPVQILTPLRASWRYGTKSGPGAMAWYPQHTLHRQTDAGDWGPVIRDVTTYLKGKYDNHQ